MESPFESILHTNGVPSDTQCTRIQELLVGARQEAASLTEEILRIQSHLDELTRKRDCLETFIDAHLALLSPARRLPQDVIRAVFIASMPTDNAGMTPKEVPLVLCQICSAWRYVALSTPQLWASIRIVIPRNSKIEQLADGITCWLSRSGILPLSISLGLKPTQLHECQASSLLTSLSGFSARWKAIHIALPDFSALEALSHLTSQDVPVLRTVSIDRQFLLSGNGVGLWSCDSLPFLNSPSLQSISLTDGTSSTSLWLPWTQLTNLRMTRSRVTRWGWDLSITAALTMLGQCSALQSCHLEITSAAEDTDILTPVSLPLLSHIEVTSPIGWRMDDLFSNLVVPRLRSLTYSCTISTVGTPLPHMLFPSLEELNLNVPALQGDDLVRRLSLLPLLTSLELRDEPILLMGAGNHPWAVLPTKDADFFARLSPSEGPMPCPNLRRVYLRNFSAVSDNAILAFIEARTGPRREAAAQLTHITVQLTRKRQHDILLPLQPFLAGGLELELEYRDFQF
ncbi:hypothetical protein B0H19DRAFT_1141566 [Mycena capillaripes]|nr:hypothetical protein B0H19DRAFT_1141566 [Mycena capillaripes]